MTMYIYVYKSTIDKTTSVGRLIEWPTHLNGFPLTEEMRNIVDTKGFYDSTMNETIKFQFIIMKEGTWSLI